MADKIKMVKQRVSSPVSDLAARGDADLEQYVLDGLERYPLKRTRISAITQKAAPVIFVVLVGCIGGVVSINYLDALRPAKDAITARISLWEWLQPLGIKSEHAVLNQPQYNVAIPNDRQEVRERVTQQSQPEMVDAKTSTAEGSLVVKGLVASDNPDVSDDERIKQKQTLLTELGKKADVSLFHVYQSTKDASLFYLQATKGSLIVYVTQGRQLVAAPVRAAFNPVGEGFNLVDTSQEVSAVQIEKESGSSEIELAASNELSKPMPESLADVPRLTPEGILAPIPYDTTSNINMDTSGSEWSENSHDVAFSQFPLEKIRDAAILFPHLGRDLKGSVITLFDPQCHFCGMFLKEIQTYQSAGLDVYLMSLPLKGERSRKMFVSAMCAQDPQGEMQTSVKLQRVPSYDKSACTDPSSSTWDLVISKIDTQFKIKGTPYFFMSNNKSGGLSDVRHFRDTLR